MLDAFPPKNPFSVLSLSLLFAAQCVLPTSSQRVSNIKVLYGIFIHLFIYFCSARLYRKRPRGKFDDKIHEQLNLEWTTPWPHRCVQTSPHCSCGSNAVCLPVMRADQKEMIHVKWKPAVVVSKLWFWFVAWVSLCFQYVISNATFHRPPLPPPQSISLSLTGQVALGCCALPQIKMFCNREYWAQECAATCSKDSLAKMRPRR